MFGALYAVAFYLESGPDHLGAGLAGLELSVMPVAFGVVAPFAGRAADRWGARLPTVTGMLVSAAGLGALGLVRPSGAACWPDWPSSGWDWGCSRPPTTRRSWGRPPARRRASRVACST